MRTTNTFFHACTAALRLLMLVLGTSVSAAAINLPEGNRAGDYGVNLQSPKAPLAVQMYDLHNMMLFICLGIFVIVFSIMFYSIYAHRKSKGHPAANFHENYVVEVIWTLIPFLIVIGMAIPAARTVIEQKDTRNADLTIKVTGYQWKWGYDYIDDGISFLSNLSTPREQIDQLGGYNAPKGAHYLLEVDRPLVVPVKKKVRLLLTANDVIHSWWVPQLGVKQDAIPGFIRDSWFTANEPGIYRGQCTELCGKDHAYMPIVVHALPQADYAAWIAQQKKAAAAQQDDPNKEWTLEALVARGKGVYDTHCAACHQANGQGMPGNFPAIAGSKISVGPMMPHVDIVLRGTNKGMPAWSQLSDTEIAAVVTFERNSFGNQTKDLIQPAAVKKARNP